MGKIVVCVTKEGTEKTFDTAAAAAKEMGVPRTSLHRHLKNGKPGLLGKWTWRYLNHVVPCSVEKIMPYVDSLQDGEEEIKSEKGVTITTIRKDGYINATRLCQSAGKLWKNYIVNAKTEEFMAALSKTADIHCDVLVQSKQGGVAKCQGTWVHPRVATHLAQWCSAEFSVLVSGWLEKMCARDPSFASEYNDAIDNIQPSKGSTMTERTIQVKLARKLGGQMEVACEHGTADIVTEDEVIEVKKLEKYVHALGQAIAYGRTYPEKRKRVHLFGLEMEDGPTVKKAKELFCQLDIVCTYEQVKCD